LNHIYWLIVIGHWSLVIGHWSLVNCHWSLVIGHWSIVIGHWSLVIGHWSLVNCHWSLVIGHWSLVNCHWSLVIGHWSLIIGHWSIVIGHWIINPLQSVTQSLSSSLSSSLSMTKQKLKSEIIYITAMLIHYGFDLEGNHPQTLINKWIKEYEPHWIRYALLEALYQGRYKAISVEQLLWGWKRRGRTVYHFNREFERLICRKFPDSLTDMITSEFIFSYSYPMVIPDEQPSQLNKPTIIPVNFEDTITAKSDFPIETTASISDISELNINQDQDFDLDKLRSKFIPQQNIIQKNDLITTENNQPQSDLLEEILPENNQPQSKLLADFLSNNDLITTENNQPQSDLLEKFELLEEIVPENDLITTENNQPQSDLLEKSELLKEIVPENDLITTENNQPQSELLADFLSNNDLITTENIPSQKYELLEEIVPENNLITTKNNQPQSELLEEIFSENDLITTENIPSQSAVSEENNPKNQKINREKILPKPRYNFIDRINTLIKHENQRAKSAEESKPKTDETLSITEVSASENLEPEVTEVITETTNIFDQLLITDTQDTIDTNNINTNRETNQNSIDLQEIFSDDYADEIEIIHPITESTSNNSSGDYENRKKPIEQFIPEENQSPFYLKLKALAEGGNKS
jgi:hypothetical protein